MLLPAEALHPAVHVVQHLALDLGVAVVELRMEAIKMYLFSEYRLSKGSGNIQALQDVLRNVMYIHRRIIPCLDHQVDCMCLPGRQL